jgi:DNA-directed RNA polymerase beta subunit
LFFTSTNACFEHAVLFGCYLWHILSWALAYVSSLKSSSLIAHRLLWTTLENVAQQLVSLEKRELSISSKELTLHHLVWVVPLMLTSFSISDMQRKYFKRKCCLMLVLGNSVKLRRHTILGMCSLSSLVELWLASANIKFLLKVARLIYPLFCRYIIHRLLMCALGRRAEDDRDHYGNKRLDLAGPLLGGLFRMVCLNIPEY